MTNNTHIQTIQHAINLFNNQDYKSSAIKDNPLRVMQASSKKSKPRTNKHKTKQDKLTIREQEQDNPEDDLQEDLAHLEIDGAPNDYEDNLTYHEDSL